MSWSNYSPTRRLNKNLDKLSNNERLKLMLEATRRNDDEQLENVAASFPSIKVKQRDLWMTERMAAIWKISMVYWLTYSESKGNIMAAIARRSMIQKHSPEPSETDEINEDMGKIEQTLIDEYSTMNGLKKAVERMVDVVELEVQELLSYVPTKVIENVASFADLAELEATAGATELTENESLVESFYSGFMNQWPNSERTIQ